MNKNTLNKALNIPISIKGIEYIWSILRINEKNYQGQQSFECIFYFTDSIDSLSHSSGHQKLFLNVNTKEITRAPEHVTVHASESHVRLYKPLSGEKDKIDLPIFSELVTFILGQHDDIHPLYMESVFFEKNYINLIKLMDFNPWKISEFIESLHVDIIDRFSVILFVVKSSLSNEDILNHSLCKNDLKIIRLIFNQKNVQRKILCDEWDLFIIATPFVIQFSRPIPSNIGSCFRACVYSNAKQAVINLLLQAH